MKGKRTEIEFEKHELIVTQQEGFVIHYLKKPDTNCDSIRFINTQGILAVNGDYGNWIFCREFHPSSNGGVSDGYWKEKLTISSTQDPDEFDGQGTIKEIETELKEQEDLTEEEKDYLNECMSKAQEGKFDYEYFAHRENVGRYQSHEYVPLRMKTKYWLLAVFDGFDEICRRMQENENVKE